MSKGSKQRPPQVSQAELARRWELAFDKKDKTEQQLTDHAQAVKPAERIA